jgi:hypothetical protein
MARAKRSNTRGQALTDEAPQSRRVPVILTCPVCDLLLGEMPTDIHLQTHVPTVACIMCSHDKKYWRLDMDNAVYHPTWSLFYCSNCGRFAPVTKAPVPAAIPQDTMEHRGNMPDTQDTTDGRRSEPAE